MALTWKAHGAVRFPDRVAVKITVRHGKTADDHQLYAATKAVLDGLTPVRRGDWSCLPDDAPERVTFTVGQEVDPRFALFPEVHIQIQEVFR